MASSSSRNTNTDIDTDTDSNSKSKSKSNQKRRRISEEESAEWPDYFRQLEQTYRALNTVSTFLSSRKNVAPLLSSIKISVESQLKRPLEVADIAAVKYLLPSNIRFEYVHEHELAIYETSPAEDKLTGDNTNDIFLIKDNQQLTPLWKKKLVFEFVEANIAKTQLNNSRLTGKDLIRLPEYSTQAMAKLIAKRNVKFNHAVVRFFAKCTLLSVDPELVIREERERYVPVDDSEEMIDDESKDLRTIAFPALVPQTRPPIQDVVDQITSSDWYEDQLVERGCRVFPELHAQYDGLDFLMSQELVDALYTAFSVTEFYSHQAQAMNALAQGQNVIVATSTSSGKSLIYQVPVIRAIENDRASTAIYIFPTKALAQDQKRSLSEVIGLMPNLEGIVVETYDGDTPKDSRNSIRDQANVIFTNPDMLHVSILPCVADQPGWRSFFSGLKYVVIDELHVYSGVFGAHMAMIMRRLRRLCSFLGNDNVQFISCSATISNPVSHMAQVFGLPDDKITLVDNDGSPSGMKHFLSWNTPYRDPNDRTTGRRSALGDAAKILTTLTLNGVRTIAFCKVRVQCELLMRAIRTEFSSIRREEMINRVMSYRGGYVAAERRRIEKEMFEGRLLGIVATNALELGIDIGSLDAVLVVGFPFSIAALRQQSGRAGRKNKDSLTVLIGDSYPVDQYYMQNPDDLFQKSPEEVVLDLDNPLLLESHLQCAGFELPISLDSDRRFFSGRDGSGDLMVDLVTQRLVLRSKASPGEPDMFDCHPRFLPWPAKEVIIRNIDEDVYAVVDVTNSRNIVIEEIESSRTMFTVYEGKPYIVRDFDPDTKIAKVERTNVEWTTNQRDFTDVDAIEIQALKPLEQMNSNNSLAESSKLQYAYFGSIRVTSCVFGYFKMDAQNRIIDAVDVNTTPPVVTYTKGFWLDVPLRAIEVIQQKGLHLAGAIHAAEHVIIGMTTRVVMAGQGDIRTECKAPEKEFATRETQRKRPARLVFYDANSGILANASQQAYESNQQAIGTGMSRKVFEFVEEVLLTAVERVENCECELGCPACIIRTKCSEGNAVLSKAGAYIILKLLTGQELNENIIPDGPEPNMPKANSASRRVETIIPVTGRVHRAADIEILGSRNTGLLPFVLPKDELREIRM
ncbi:uncharacterized protein V1516DRAFT_695377 [Lipomyces oligophaga]|uniref:uncharacterized protein n=1 Tax=Lipomyces oligophaga TaxID=45792 RepID=UPI0034CDD4D1